MSDVVLTVGEVSLIEWEAIYRGAAGGSPVKILP